MTPFDAVERLRRVARRLVLELVASAGLLAVGAAVPGTEPPGTHWSYLAPFLLLVAHMLVGLLILVDAVRLLDASRRIPPDGRVLAVAGLGGSTVAVTAGVVSVLGLGERSPGPLMVFAWLLAALVYSRLWAAADRVHRTAPTHRPTHCPTH